MDTICFHEPKDPPSALLIHEWISILAISSMLLCLAFVSLLDQHDPIETSFPYIPKPTITITVTGAVAKPGVYEVTQGTFLGEVLDKVQPLVNARLKNFKRDQKLLRNRKLHVPRQIGLRPAT